jgi:diguanylate cyclase (GGDEF)-like protein
MRIQPRPYGTMHIGYLLLFGVGGWVALLVQSMMRAQPIWQELGNGSIVGGFVLVGSARLLTFRIYRKAHIALDSAFYIAARFVFGTLSAAWMLAMVLTLDAAVRIYLGKGPAPKGRAPLIHSIGHILCNGGLPTVVLMTSSWCFGGDQSLHTFADRVILWHVPCFALLFLLTHYLMASLPAWFTGAKSAYLLTRFLPRVVGAELLLVPLSLAMVLAYKYQGAELFFLLGGTGILFGGIFRRWTIAREKLDARVVELSTINRISRIISSSFDQDSLFESLSVAALQLVGQGSLFLIGLVDEQEHDEIDYLYYDASGQCTAEFRAHRDQGLSGWVLRNRQPLCLGDLNKQYMDYAQSDEHYDQLYASWVGVPLVVHGDVVGVMSVQSLQSEAYTQEHLQVLEIIADQTVVAVENSRLYQLATVDGLTGLFVRRYLDQRLSEEWHRSGRYGNGFSLGLLDLDRFKVLNDTYGHQAGDQALREAARVVRANMRSFDLAARYGGEEFAFILPRTDMRDALAVAERIRQGIAELRIHIPEEVLRITASIGVVECPGPGIRGEHDLVRLADEALYRAKNEGRNRVVSGNGEDEFPLAKEMSPKLASA